MNIQWEVLDGEAEIKSIIEDLLPPEFKYKIVSIKDFLVSKLRKESKFTIKILSNICSKNDVHIFLRSFSQISGTSYNINGGDRKNQAKVLKCCSLE